MEIKKQKRKGKTKTKENGKKRVNLKKRAISSQKPVTPTPGF